VVVMLTTAAAAQSTPAPPNALQGFSQNRNQPINIESTSLEVRDKEKTATFIDNVRVVQGDTTLECKRLVVFYDEEAPAGTASKPGKAGLAKLAGAKPGGAATPGQQQIRRMEALGGVVVTQKDQTAVGEKGVYDMKTNIITLTGNVVVSQGSQVISGERLWVDLNTNVSRVESAGKPVSAVFMPGAMKPGTMPGASSSTPNSNPPADGARAQNANPDQSKAKQTPARPLKLN
jgi:lipopolysaccharide export system protein LptA